MDSEERKRKLELLKAHKETRHALELQVIRMGSHTPAYVRTDLRNAEEQIEKLEKELGISEEPEATPSEELEDSFTEPTDSTPDSALRNRPMFELRARSLPPTRDIGISRRYVEDLLEELPPPKPTYVPKYESAAPSLFSLRWLILLISFVGTIYIFIAAQKPIYQDALRDAFAPSATKTPAPLMLNSTWKGDNISLTLADVSYSGEYFILRWDLTNISGGPLVIPRASYESLRASAFGNIEVMTRLASCPGFSCDSGYTLSAGEKVHFIHTIQYPGIQVEQITTPVYVTAGLSGDTQWKIK